MIAVVAVFICLSLSIPVFTLICAKKRRHTVAKHANNKNSPLPPPSSPICTASLAASQVKVSTAHTPERIGIKKGPDAKKHEEKKAEVVKEDSSIADKTPEDKPVPNADARKVKSNEHLDQSDSDDVKKDKVRDRIEPHRISLNDKEKLIALGAKRNKDDYPTMGDIISDWESKEDTQKKKDQKTEQGYKTHGGERGGFELPGLEALRSREIMKVRAQSKKKSGEPIEDEEKTQRKATEDMKEANVEEGVRRTEEGVLVTEEIKRLASEMLGVKTEDPEKLRIIEEDHRRRRAQRKRRVELEREMMRDYEEEMRNKEYADRRKMADESAEKILERKSREKEEFKKQEEQQEKKGKSGEIIRMDLDMKETQKTRSKESASKWKSDILVTKQTQRSAERDFVDVEERPKDPITEGCNEIKKQNLFQSKGEGEKQGLEEKCIRDVVKFSDTNVRKSFAQKTQKISGIDMVQKNFQTGVNSSNEGRKEKEGHSLERKGEKNHLRSDKDVKKKK